MCLYNKDLKEWFLEQYSENTQKMYRYVLSKSAGTEESLKKDLCNFTYDELDELFMGFEAKSLPSAISHISIVTRYIDFCLNQPDNFVPSGINYSAQLAGGDINRYVSVTISEQKIITLEDLKNIDRQTLNMQDFLPFALLFYGVKGEAFEEILNLKTEDYDENKRTLILTTNSGEKREINDLPDYLCDAIDRTKEDNKYVRSNGRTNQHRHYDVIKLEKTPYLFKRVRAETENNDDDDDNFIGKNSATVSMVNVRVSRIARFLGYRYLNPTNIWLSGMIHYIKEHKEKNNIKELTNEDYEMANRRFGYRGNSRQYVGITRKKIEQYLL